MGVFDLASGGGVCSGKGDGVVWIRWGELNTLSLPSVPAMWMISRVYGGRCALSKRIRVRLRSTVDIDLSSIHH